MAALIISDFDRGGDVIRLQGITSDSTIYEFDAFIAASSDTSEGVFVSFEGDANGFFIEGVTLADLSSDDVLFTGGTCGAYNRQTVSLRVRLDRIVFQASTSRLLGMKFKLHRDVRSHGPSRIHPTQLTPAA
jgi:hypothetical protein